MAPHTAGTIKEFKTPWNLIHVGFLLFLIVLDYRKNRNENKMMRPRKNIGRSLFGMIDIENDFCDTD